MKAQSGPPTEVMGKNRDKVEGGNFRYSGQSEKVVLKSDV